MKFTYHADMGSIKIFTPSVALFFGNGIGDGVYTVYVHKQRIKIGDKWKFVEHFTVKTSAHLSSYDCSDDAIYEFQPGRYFVYRDKNGNMKIVYCDADLHA